jgi:beta-mannosidase
MSKINLNTEWNILYEGLEWGPDKSSAILQKKEGWLQHDLPCDVHMPLIENGIIKEPLEEDNCFKCEWTEDKSWWFKKVFEIDSTTLNNDVIELIMESLDAEADIFLNGYHLGHHKSAFYPFVMDVKTQLLVGENVLLVRLTSGIEYYSDFDLAGMKLIYYDDTGVVKGKRGDKRRVFVRKPQYVYGWDWGPRVATCGIMKGAFINAYKKLAISSVYASTISTGTNAKVSFEMEINNLHPFSTIDAILNIEVLFKNEKVFDCEKDVFLKSGKNYIQEEAIIDNAKLWWPNGMGEQPLYTVRISAYVGDVQASYPDFKFGIRTICVNQERLNAEERRFAFVVNGVETFCKGGNWVPADSIYARVTDGKYDALVREAKEANFNMLRVWGGGLYERDIFYQKCDEYGIMIWHDFMFACGVYPDNLIWFKQEVEKEIDYQTTRLRNHASIALWCGNNEIHWLFDENWTDTGSFLVYQGNICYNQIAPSIIQRNCPQIFYWNSSPYGGENPNGTKAGDRHHWHDCTMNPDMEKRITPEEYDKVEAKFVSEYGYIGPCRKSSIVKYHGDAELDRNSRVWQLHNNAFEKDTVAAGIKKHYSESEKLDLDSYLLYAGLCQGLMYQYSLEAIRFKENCGGALFWMYSDCWGEVGWTIIDYYLKRKISYYFVKRAFSPVKLILREIDGVVKVLGMNDTEQEICFEMEYGYTDFKGKDKDCSITSIKMEPHSRKMVFEFIKGDHDYTKGISYIRALSNKCSILPATLKLRDFNELEIAEPNLIISDFEKIGDTARFTISSDSFAHAVHFNLDDSITLSDEYFDLLAGECRIIEIYGIKKTFFADAIKPHSVI